MTTQDYNTLLLLLMAILPVAIVTSYHIGKLVERERAMKRRHRIRVRVEPPAPGLDAMIAGIRDRAALAAEGIVS